MGAAAGLATLRTLTPDVYARLDRLGDGLRGRVAGDIARLGLDAHVEGLGSLFQVFVGEDQSAVATCIPTQASLFLGLLLEGFYLAPRGMGAIPAIATEADVDELGAAITRQLAAGVQVPERGPA